MTDLVVVPNASQWRKLKALVLDSVSSPITKARPFAFYNPFEVACGQQIGSNYDPAGNTQGPVTVAFP